MWFAPRVLCVSISARVRKTNNRIARPSRKLLSFERSWHGREIAFQGEVRIAYFVLFLPSLIIPLGAQSRSRSIGGTVTDPDHAAVPSVQVVLKGSGSRQQRVTRTDAEGRFNFSGLEASRYEIHVPLKGFKDPHVEVDLSRGSVANLAIALELAGLDQEIVVTAEASGVATDPGENAAALRLSRELLDELPILGNDPVTAAAAYLDPSAIGTGGATLIVDGIETTEAGVSASAIQEIRINQNPYSAEFFSPGRNRIEITTRKGDPQFHGDARFVLRDYRLDARNAFAVVRPAEQRKIFEGRLSGPLGSKKYYFVLSGEHEQDDVWSPLYALTPSGLVRDQVFQPESEDEFSILVERRASSGSSASVRYERSVESSEGIGAGGFRLPEAAADERDASNRIQVSHHLIHSPAISNQLAVRLRTEAEERISRTQGVPRIVVVDAFTSGGGQADRRESEQRMELTNVVSWPTGRHFVRAGVNLRDLARIRHEDLTDRDGAFYFSSLDDYRAGRPFSFTRKTGDGRALFWRASAGGFVQDDFKVKPNLTVGMGIRYDAQTWIGDGNDFAPRLSIAYAPGSSRKYVIRAGAGIFYDRLDSDAPLDAILFDGTRLRQSLVPSPTYPDVQSASGAILPANIVRLARDIITPYLLHFMTAVEREIAPKTTLSIAYSGIRGRKQFRSLDLNGPLPETLERPDPGIATLRQLESSGSLERHALEISLRGRMTPYFNGAVLYTLGRTWNHGSANSPPANSYDLRGEWARASSDRLHRFRVVGALKVAKFFTLGTILTLESGSPYSLTTGRDENRDGSATDRPHGVPRNSLQGPGEATLDLRWSRAFPVWPRNGREPHRVTIAVDAFNVTNRVNYSGFVGNLSSPFFGRPVNAGSARRVQLGIRFSF